MTRIPVLAAALALLAGIPALAAPTHQAAAVHHVHANLARHMPRQCESQYNIFTGKWTTSCEAPMGK